MTWDTMGHIIDGKVHLSMEYSFPSSLSSLSLLTLQQTYYPDVSTYLLYYLFKQGMSQSHWPCNGLSHTIIGQERNVSYFKTRIVKKNDEGEREQKLRLDRKRKKTVVHIWTPPKANETKYSVIAAHKVQSMIK